MDVQFFCTTNTLLSFRLQDFPHTMSWFDPSGIRWALKEAQKTIDKALDIKEDDSPPVQSLPDSTSDAKADNSNTSTIDSTITTISLNNPVLPASIWGSFTGSFFDNPHNADDETRTSATVTKAPARQKSFNSKESQNQVLSESSSSVEIVTPPISPASSLPSPDEAATIQCSESIEVISNLNTPTSELVTVSSSASELDSSSAHIISEDLLLGDDNIDDDSKSYNTVSETIAMVTAATSPPNRCALHLSLANSADIPKLLEDASQEKSLEDQTHLSDSTQSFEYVNQTSAVEEGNNRGGGSPHSSEEHVVDEIKITSGSGHTSEDPHTSADEVETTTSSDIEIISSPNGDSSSTNSAYKASSSTMCTNVGGADSGISASAATIAKKIKGHCRDSSTHSIQSTVSDDFRICVHSSESEVLMRRISELSEVLESREYKLMELGREHAELFEQNSEMKQQLEAKRKRDDCLEITTVTEEYTQRLSALEKKFQQSIRERESLRAELLGKVSRADMQEKDFLCEELQREGEKLSKQILQQSTIIKKLRSKEKENEGTIKRQKQQLEENSDEIERLNRAATAKATVERSQIEAVHNLSVDKRTLEKETAQLRSQLDDTTQRLKALQNSFDAAKREITDKQHTHAELSRKTIALASIESENMATKNQNQQMATEVTYLRDRLRQVEDGTSMKEQLLRQENTKLLRRLEDAEQKLEQQSQSVTDATIPLIKQIDSLQASLNLRTSAWENQEKSLLEKLTSIQNQLKLAIAAEQQVKVNDAAMTAKIIQLEERLSAALLKIEQTSSTLQQRDVELELSKTGFRTKVDALKSTIFEYGKTIEEKQGTIAELQKQLDISVTHRKQLQEVIEVISIKSGSTLLNNDEENEVTGTIHEPVSPTPSLGHISVADSLSSTMWHLVCVIETIEMI